MRNRFQFRLSNALLGLFWTAIWLATIANRNRWMASIDWDWHGLQLHLCLVLYFATPCLAVGTFLGRPLLGLLFGLVSTATMIVWSLNY